MQTEPAEAGADCMDDPTWQGLLSSAIASAVLNVVCLATYASGHFSDFVIAPVKHQ